MGYVKTNETVHFEYIQFIAKKTELNKLPKR